MDKLHAADTLEDVLTAAAAATDGLPARPIGRLVLIALERRTDEAGWESERFREGEGPQPTVFIHIVVPTAGLLASHDERFRLGVTDW